MKVRVAFLLLCACAACRSGRDYTSLNKSSFKFTMEGFRESWRGSKRNLRQDLAFKERAPENRRDRRESRAFLWDTLISNEGENFRNLLTNIKESTKTPSERLASMRFGFLDSGE